VLRASHQANGVPNINKMTVVKAATRSVNPMACRSEVVNNTEPAI
jgi:hypothetical protein